MTVRIVQQIDPAANGPVGFLAGLGINGGDQYIYAFSRDARRALRFDNTGPGITARSPDLGARPTGGAVSPVLLNPVWVETDDGRVHELRPDTLGLNGTFGPETFGYPLTPLSSIGWNNNVLFLQGLPGEIIAWSTITRSVLWRADTGLGDIASTCVAVDPRGEQVDYVTDTLASPGTDHQPGLVFPERTLYAGGPGVPMCWRNGALLRYGIDYYLSAPGEITNLADPQGDYMRTDQFRLLATAAEAYVFCVNGRGQLAIMGYGTFVGFRRHAFLSIPGLTDVRDTFPLQSGALFPGAMYLVAGPTEAGRLITVSVATPGSFQSMTDVGLQVQLPGATASNPAVAVSRQDFDPSRQVVAFSHDLPSDPNFRTATLTGLPGDFRFMPVAVAQQGVGRLPVGPRFIIPGLDGAFWYYSESDP